jgi:hypothetical protein
MSYLSHLVTSIAISDIDVAAEGLNALIDPQGQYYPPLLRSSNETDSEGGGPLPDPLEWAHYVCTYSRYLYLNVSKYRCSVGRVQDEIIPLLEKARQLIVDLIEKADFDKEVETELSHYGENISLRIKNLRSYA